MLKLNKKSDYGLILLAYLKDKQSFVPLSQFVEETGLPQRFVARIASDLTRSGILRSKEGKIGGYAIAKALDKVNLYEFFSIFDRIALTSCCGDGKRCPYERVCQHKDFLKGMLSTRFINILKEHTLADLFVS